MVSLESCGPYVWCPLERILECFLSVSDFRIVLQKIEQDWEQKLYPILICLLDLLRSSQRGNTLQRTLKLYLLKRYQSEVHNLSPI